jgi:hypothetical protein
MSTFYPQMVMVLSVLWEDYKRGSASKSQAGNYTIALVPESVSVKINDYRTADTFNCELDYKNFPFDPRSIRSIQVTVHVEDARRILDWPDAVQPKPETTIFAGFADETTIDLDEDNRKVSFSGRDLTSILIDTRWDGTLVDVQNVTLDVVIKRILGKLDATKGLKVSFRIRGKMPTLAQIPGGYGDPAAGPDGELRNKRSARPNESYWDVIQDLITRAGLIGYIEIDTLVITDPNALYDRKDAKQFIYGRNLTSLQMKRKIGRVKDINLKLTSMNPRLAEPVITCHIPRDATPAFKKRMKVPDGDIMIERIRPDGTKEEKPEPAPFLAFNIPRAPSRQRLIEIGENIFEEMSRQQIEGQIKTGEMMGRNLQGVEFDLTKMRIGTPIDIKIDNSDLVGMREIDSETEREHYLRERGYTAEVAKYFAKTFTGFGSPFYTKGVEMAMGADDGFSLTIEYVNFIELKEDLIK